MSTATCTLCVVAVLALAMASCATPSAPVVPTSDDNDLHGYVELWDSCGGVDADLAGVIVTATTSSWSGSDTTGVDGTWSIPNAPAGVYTINAIRGSYLAPPITNLQYVGVGKYDVKEVWLAAAVPAQYITSAEIGTTYWAYEMQTLENGQDVKVDSTYVINVNVVTKCAQHGPLDYRITETPDADCFSAVVAGVSNVVNIGTMQSVNLSGVYKKLVKLYGSSLAGKRMYLQIRNKQVGKRPDGTVGCIDPVVVELQY
jgi:hypothetical protein